MLEYIQSPEFYQLIADEPFLLLLFAVLAAVTFIAAIASLPAWFTIRTEHHHYHYHTGANTSHNSNPLEGVRAGYYHVDASGRVRSVVPQEASPRQSAWDAGSLSDIYNGLFGQSAAVSTSQPQSGTSKPVSRTNNRPKMSKGKRFRILRRDSFRCCLCGHGPDDSEGLTLHVDHRMPVAEGGSNDDENLWTLCSECNIAKSDTIMEELFPSEDEDGAQSESESAKPVAADSDGAI